MLGREDQRVEACRYGSTLLAGKGVVVVAADGHVAQIALRIVVVDRDTRFIHAQLQTFALTDQVPKRLAELGLGHGGRLVLEIEGSFKDKQLHFPRSFVAHAFSERKDLFLREIPLLGSTPPTPPTPSPSFTPRPRLPETKSNAYAKAFTAASTES